MNITKLTITPISKGLTPFVEYNPSNKIASQLITERLVSGHDTSVPRVFRKLPKHLRGWVNPQAKVIPNTKINSYI